MLVYGVGLHQLPTIVTGHRLVLRYGPPALQVSPARRPGQARLLNRPGQWPCPARLLRCGGRGAAAASKYASEHENTNHPLARFETPPTAAPQRASWARERTYRCPSPIHQRVRWADQRKGVGAGRRRWLRVWRGPKGPGGGSDRHPRPITSSRFHFSSWACTPDLEERATGPCPERPGQKQRLTGPFVVHPPGLEPGTE